MRVYRYIAFGLLIGGASVLAGCGGGGQAAIAECAGGVCRADTDRDGDGVLDAADQCPDTPAAEPVDLVGCAETQKDADGDGINNGVDLCAGTPAGYGVDAQGCSARHCNEQVGAATGACFTAAAARLRECHLANGVGCATNDPALASALDQVDTAVDAACASTTVVPAAGFGAAGTSETLTARLRESCDGNARQLVARTFGGPHAKTRNAAVDGGKACLDAAYQEAGTLIATLAGAYRACAVDEACDGAALVAEEPVAKAQAQALVAAACVSAGTTLKDALGTPEDLFVTRAARQAHCLVAESIGDTGSLPLTCGPDDARFANVTLSRTRAEDPADLLANVDAIPRGVPIRVRMDIPAWDARCGDGSDYAFWIKLAPQGEPIGNVQFMLQGGGACLTPADCAIYADAGKFTALNDGDGMVALRSDDPRNPLRSWTHVVMPYCTQDLHLGGGTAEPFASEDTPETSGVVYRYGAINVRAAFEFVRDLVWRRLRAETADGYRPDLMKVIFTGNSAGGYGVNYNYHYPLDELRWSSTLGHPHASLIIDGGKIDVLTLMKAKAEAWNIRPYLPSYCHFDECALSRFHLPAYSERIDDRFPFQHYAITISQHDPSGESQQYRGDDPAGWINGVRKLYCDLKDYRLQDPERGDLAPNIDFYLPVPADNKPVHGFLDAEILDPASDLSIQMAADDIPVITWLTEVFGDPDAGYDAVEEGTIVGVVPNVKPFVAFGCTVDGEDPGYEEPPAPPLVSDPGAGSMTGCTVTGAGPAAVSGSAANQTCSYVADGPGTWRSSTVNNWNIKRYRDGQESLLAQGHNPADVTQEPGRPRIGVLDTRAGDTVVVTLIYNNNFGGTTGTVSAGGVIGTPPAPGSPR